MPGKPPKIQPIHSGDRITADVMNSFADVLLKVVKVGPGLAMRKANNKIIISATRKARQ